MGKFYLLLEAAVASVFTLLIFLVIRFFPFSFELLKPFKQEAHDLDIYDLYFSGREKVDHTRDSNIVLVEVASTRKDIANQIALIRKCRPAVIGVDIMFPRGMGNEAENRLLEEQAASCDSIIWAYRFGEDSSGSVVEQVSFFSANMSEDRIGYINFRGGKYSVARNFRPFLEYSDKEHVSFSARIAQHFAPDKFQYLKRRNNRFEEIYYTGNTEHYSSFGADSLNYYFMSGQLHHKLANKIVLIGVFKRNAPYIMEDIHFTPLNERFTGRSFPDMYGVTIHANIISMILGGKYIKVKSALFSCILAFLLTLMFSFYILSRYDKKKHPSHFGFIILQLLLICSLIYLFLLIFEKFQIKVPLLPIIMMLVLCVEAIGIYKRIAVWMHKKWNFPTIFIKHIDL